MPGELDGAVDSLAQTPRTTQTPQARLQRGEAFTASGESPAVDSASTNYHLDVPIAQRPPFARSISQDGGLAVLSSPNGLSATAKEALLAEQQEGWDESTSVVMKPRKVEMARGDRAKPGTGVHISSEEVGLALRPIMIQRQADVDEMGAPLNPESFKTKTFLSDGTSKGGRRIDESGADSVEDAEAREAAGLTKPTGAVAVAAENLAKALGVDIPQGGAEALMALLKQASPQPGKLIPSTPAPEEPAMPATPKQRVVFSPPDGGKVRARVDDVIIGDTILILVYDADSDTTYEPGVAGKDAPIDIEVDSHHYTCMYGGWSAESNGRLYLVFVLIDTSKDG